MRHAAVMLLSATLALAACGPDVPELDARIDALDSAFPDLVPLGPLLAQTDAVPAREAEPEGESLEARADSLRRRAAALRAMPL
ncbi:hypothetical protein P6F26_17240 [Roseibacterium sp. SDUM158017]|uniref:hypothetical protein n=1 Tax=Roseicyclus salinarum TaxID=3036773 RepID=UPI002415696B|nr:hypothetical protein [Roseibacterium sp. SDUM158017]MDG4650196.1 hypothetical protein [Roseibacterium sp. SDUM158017]